MMLSVVIIDDNINNLLLEKDLMEVEGFDVFEATNASDGIALIKKVAPNVIIMDVRLPDMSGLHATRVLRHDKKLVNIPVVFVTASVLEIERNAILNIPNSGFVSKPIDTRTFAKEIRKYIK